MKTCVVSYSLTGNNEALAHGIAEALQAKHVRITETRRRTEARIMIDLILNRTPRILLPLDTVESYDLVLFVGPVWIGQVATPFRACFQRLRSRIRKYAFVSIAGGADGPNPGIAGELAKRLGAEPAFVADLHIADLLPPEPKPQRKDTSAYRLTPRDVQGLTDRALQALSGVVTPAAAVLTGSPEPIHA